MQRIVPFSVFALRSGRVRVNPEHLQEISPQPQTVQAQGIALGQDRYRRYWPGTLWLRHCTNCWLKLDRTRASLNKPCRRVGVADWLCECLPPAGLCQVCQPFSLLA